MLQPILLHRLRTLATSIALGILPCGCAVPYAYPRVDLTKPIRLSESAQGVTAFRVAYTAAGNPKWDRRASDYQISLLPLDPTQSEIPQQAHVGVERGLYLYMFQLSHDLKVGQGVEVRLYKRGYRTVQVGGGYRGGPIQMTPAKSRAEWESAIDALFGPDVAGLASTQPAEDLPVSGPAPADEVFAFTRIWWPPFVEACRFGVEEYEWLAADPASSADDRRRVEAKSSYLKKIAPGK